MLRPTPASARPWSIFQRRLPTPINPRWFRLRHGHDHRRILALGLAILLGAAVYQVTARANSVVSGLGQVRSVSVATRDLPSGHRLRAEDTNTVQWPIRLLPKEPVIGDPTRYVLTHPVLENEVLVTARVGSGPFGLQADEVAVTIPEPLAPPPVELGHRVMLFSIQPSDGPFIKPASELAMARVIALPEGGITLAVHQSLASKIVDSLSRGAIELVITPD